MADSRSVPFVDLSLQHSPLRSELLTAMAAVADQGDYILGHSVEQFERAFATVCDAQFGVGVGSGTEALTLGLRACGISPGDQVILPVNTFVATLIGILQTGATPVFVDCNVATGLMDLSAAERAINRRTRAIIPVHLYGQMVSPHALCALAAANGLTILEDAAQAHGAKRDGIKAGSIGLAAAFSFYPSKNLGAMGDGGIVVTQKDVVAQAVRSLRNYGSNRKYYHTDPGGTNSRLDTLQAALLNVKLTHLQDWNRDRNRLAQRYDSAFKPLAINGVVPMTNHSGSGHVYHLYVIRVTSECEIDRTCLQQELAAWNIQSGIHYPIPCHLQPAFHHLGYQSGDFPIAEQLSQEILSLPMYPGMTDNQQDYVIERLTAAVRASPVLI
ncbi:MAG: DegT/DnrJ/EryC1/StrS family aminotransferase [Symploca sp. SIO2G7]|nr:DegT/DnrJ/EryC1/StrS family aminotransferase [Symploca sp. SIO2G7]